MHLEQAWLLIPTVLLWVIGFENNLLLIDIGAWNQIDTINLIWITKFEYDCVSDQRYLLSVI